MFPHRKQIIKLYGTERKTNPKSNVEKNLIRRHCCDECSAFYTLLYDSSRSLFDISTAFHLIQKLTSSTEVERTQINQKHHNVCSSSSHINIFDWELLTDGVIIHTPIILTYAPRRAKKRNKHISNTTSFNVVP